MIANKSVKSIYCFFFWQVLGDIELAQEMQKEKDKMAAVSQVTKLKIHILQFIFLMKFLII
jgi:hypothetical protein